MSEIRFYHLTRTPLEQALPTMLERVLSRGQRAVVMLGSEARREAMAHHLWVYNDRAFLPHGTEKDGHAADQPIWLTAQEEAPNGAEVLFLCDGAEASGLDQFALVALLFDGRDAAAVETARGHWRQWRDAGHSLSYWQQMPRGWEQKA
jgi:DNA polymerase-3 subunit chi